MSVIIIDGIVYERVFVSELEPGMVDSFGEAVERVERVTDDRTRVEWADASVQYFGHADTTILIDATTIPEED